MALTRFLGVVCDLDGTLLRSDGTLSPATVEMLGALRERAVPLVVATARTPRAVQRIAGHRQLGPAVCANGAIVWNPRADELVHEVCFPAPALLKALSRVRTTIPDVAVAVLSARRMYLDDRYVALRPKGLDEDLPMSAAGQDEASIVMVALRHPRLGAEDLIGPATEAFADLGSASFAGPSVVDVVPAGVTKAGTAARVLARLGCPPEATVAFGDMPNDLPLFAWAGWAAAVGNAHPVVLESADEVVAANDDDGVARTVARLLRGVGR